MQRVILGQSIVDLSLRQLTFKDEDQKLEPKTAQLLALLIQHQGEMVTRDHILAEIYPGQYVTDGAINRLMADLRKVLHRDPTLKNCIRTVPKSGYQLQVVVSPLPSACSATSLPPTSEPSPSSITAQSRAWLLGSAVLLLLGILTFFGFQEFGEHSCKNPLDWGIGGSNPSAYRACIDNDEGAPAPSIHIEGAGKFGFVALSRFATAENYRAQRVRFTLQVRVEPGDALLGLYLRADKAGQAKELAFINSSQKGDPITETNGWAERSLELDIPVDADAVVYGIYLQGTGEAWIDQPVIKLVDDQSLNNGAE